MSIEVALLIAGVIMAGFAAWTFWLKQELKSSNEEVQREINRENNRVREVLDHLSQRMTHAMTDTRQSVQEDLKHSGLLMSNIHTKLGELSETSRQIHNIGKNIASLQELLKAPKLRGGVGEYLLEDIISQILPSSFFDTQYAFQSGQIVDAVIRLGDRLVPIDAKFPLESFQVYLSETDTDQALKLRKEFVRAVHKHIDVIATKYILPSEGTFDFALMYIPAENVYYETIIKEGEGSQEARPIFEYAIGQKVIPVSPNSIYAYLQVIILGLKGFQIEGQTHEILKKLSSLKQEFGKVENDFGLVGKHLQNTSRNFEKARSRLSQFGSKVDQIESPDTSLPKSRSRIAAGENSQGTGPKVTMKAVVNKAKS